MGAVTVRGEVPGWALRLGDGYGCVYGDGYGDGSGSGSGYGYGYGDGSGYGYGYGYGYGSDHGDGCGGCSGYGDGSGYGEGDGYGDGYGPGDGSGYGDGSVYGYGSGSGSGSGSGYSDGDDLERSAPAESVHVTFDMLRGACTNHVRLFRRVFPDGAVYPDDLPRAVAAGLDVSWAYREFGLLPVIDEDFGAPAP